MHIPAILTASRPDEPWPDMPIEPTWIRQGVPVARGIIISQSADQKLSSGFWSCTPGEFDWHFSWDEFIYIFEGEVTITERNGKVHQLHAGDVVHFPLGMEATWRVTRTIKKFFVIRTPDPLAY